MPAMIPSPANPLVEQARGHHDAGDLAAAEALYLEARAADPHAADAAYFHGMLLCQTGRSAEGIPQIRAAVAASPSAERWHNLGVFLAEAGQFDAAIDAERRALECDPLYVLSHVTLGQFFLEVRRFPDACTAFERALALVPDRIDVLGLFGDACVAASRPADAIAAFRRALAIDPGHGRIASCLAFVLVVGGEFDEAETVLRRALAVRPDAAAFNNLANVLRDVGRTAEAIEQSRAAVAADPRDAAAHGTLLYGLLFQEPDPAVLAAEHRAWNEIHAAPLLPAAVRHPNPPDPDRRLRVGYVSPNLFNHVVGHNMLPLFRHHDPARVEVHVYSDVASGDAVTAVFRAASHVWHDCVGLSHEALADRIRADEIDVLVDLTLHMSRNRLPCFARRPAPVQVTFAGYPGTTGMPAIDYRLTDPHIDPPGRDDTVYAERSWRLPHSFWCYAERPEHPPVGDLPAVAAGRVTFGCLNSPFKLTPPMLATWARVLAACPGSRLVVMAHGGNHAARVRADLAVLGIAPERVDCVSRLSPADYFQTYRRIDVMLDTFPYGGHTTGLDALFMGVPVVTLAGATVVSRAGAGHWANLGAESLGAADLVTSSPDAYEAAAVRLAHDLPRLTDLRAALRDRMRKSPLMDAAGFAAGIEDAYRGMWTAWCAGAAAERPRA